MKANEEPGSSFSRRSLLQGAVAISVAATVADTLVAAAPIGDLRRPSGRTARNLQIAQKFYDAYHNAPVRDSLAGQFDPVDFAHGWQYCTSVGGEKQPDAATMQRSEEAQNRLIRKRLLDYHADDFAAWPTEWGAAWRWRVTGRPIESDDLYQFYETMFMWTNTEGKVTRLEHFRDWHGFVAATAYALNQSMDKAATMKGYGRSPWPAPPSIKFTAPQTPAQPPGSELAARNLALAEKYFTAFNAASASLPRGPFMMEDFAENAVLFSPSAGERVLIDTFEGARRKLVDHRQIRTLLPDYKMENLAAWPTEDGVAWRWLVRGRSKAGASYEFWENIFMRTDSRGKITRLEWYDDFLGFPQMVGFLTGLSLENLDTMRQT